MRKAFSFHQAGVTFIEMLVAMAIALIVSLVVSGVFVSARQTSRYSEGLSRYQESLRFAEAAIADDIRSSGQLGCRRDLTTTTGLTVSAAGVTYVQPIQGVAAWAASSSLGSIPTTGALVPVTGSDAIRIEFASRDTNSLSASMASPSALISVTDAATYAVTQPLVIADCTKADIFLPTSVVGTSITPASPLSQAYSAPISQVYQFFDRAYYINNSFQLVQLTGGTQSIIADGIEQLKFWYGEDLSSTPTVPPSPSHYVDAASVTHWDKIYAVRVCMLVRSKDQNLTIKSSYADCTYPAPSTAPTSTDGRLRFPVNFTVEIR